MNTQAKLISLFYKKTFSVNGQLFNPKLLRVQIDITNRCNLLCKHCRASANQKGKDILSVADFRNIFDDLQKIKIEKIILSGGEPFLRNDLLEIISLAEKMDFQKLELQAMVL